jgi:hypothetical protein
MNNDTSSPISLGPRAHGSAPMPPDARLEARLQLFAAYGATYPMPTERKQGRRLAFRDVDFLRLLAGLAAAGLAASAIAIDMGYTEPHPGIIWQLAVCAIGSEALWLVAGAICVLTLWRIRGFIRLADCLVIGAGLGLLQLPVDMQMARLVAPLATAFHHTRGHIHDWNPVDLSIATYLWAGAVLFGPFGALGGWLLWKILCPHSDDPEGLSQPRRRANPITARFVLGLVIVPLIPALALTAVLTLVLGGERSGIAVAAWTMGDGELVSFVGGTALAMLIATRRPIRRADCLWLGMGSALLLPLIMHFVGKALSQFGADIWYNLSGGLGEVADIACALLAGYFVMLTGLPGGWLLWRIAFRDRQSAPLPLSSVFE